MIKIICRCKVKKGCEAEYERIAGELVRKSKTEEGCVDYSNNKRLEDGRAYAFVEIWKDEAAIERHNASAHFRELVPKLGALREGEGTTEHYVQVE